jgi:hypothetical protein
LHRVYNYNSLIAVDNFGMEKDEIEEGAGKKSPGYAGEPAQ